MNKLWIGDKIFLVDEEVHDEIERLNAEVERQKSTIESFQIQALAENNTCLEQAYKIDRLTALDGATEIERLYADIEHGLGVEAAYRERIAKLEAALTSIVGQTDDQFVDGVWREVNTTAREALEVRSGSVDEQG
jgi:hypothetical protein